MAMVKAELPRKRLTDVQGFIDALYGHDLHAKRVEALAGATLGVMTGASLAVATIGQALAQARGLVTKHAIKQVDALRAGVSLILAAQTLLLSAGEARTQTNPPPHKMEYWLGAIPPVVQRDHHKAIPSDYDQLFSAPDQYRTFGARMTTFAVPTQFILRATPEEQRLVLDALRLRRIKLAGELGVVIQSPDPACGGFGEGRGGPNVAAQVANKLHDIGGTLDYLNMDEPVTFGHLSPQNKCPQPIPLLATIAASRIAIYRAVFPAMKVNLVDAVGSRSPTFVHDEVQFVDLLGRQGVHIDYFIADVQWDTAWQAVLEELAPKLHARGIKVGLYCNGSLAPKTDEQWAQESIAHCQTAGDDPKISPDLFVIASWSVFPTHVLPEDKSGTLTNIGKQLMSLFP